MVIGIDQDQDALAAATRHLAHLHGTVRLLHGNFRNLSVLLDQAGVGLIDGFLFDLGVSSHQLDQAERGFSFQQDAPLDMRMNQAEGETAADLVNELSEQELERILRELGEERWARRIAQHICSRRNAEPIVTTFHLVDVVKGAVPKACWEQRIHPATRTFQALRIAVNHELESLEQGITSAFNRLKPGGRGVVISFHSLEDRMVKQLFRNFATGCICPPRLPLCQCGKSPQATVLTGRPVTASRQECDDNPRARSAKLRAVEKAQELS